MGKEAAYRVLQKLEERGFEAYFVGGCVRDWLLGRPVHDIDICTNALPDDVMRLFPDHIPTGLRHGTVTVRSGSHLLEVTTFRTDGEYTDYRRPRDVQFVTDLKTDLQRRDFTINAMAMDRQGRLHDPFAGQMDLNDRLIRAVGEAEKRFREDGLRLLRAARFAAQLDFDVEPATLQAMEQAAPLLRHVAVERIRDELGKLVDSHCPQKGCDILVQTQLLHFSPLLERLFSAAQQEAWRLTHLGTVAQKWALMCYAAGFRQDEAASLCQGLRMSRREREAIVRFVQILSHLCPEWDQPKNVEWGPLLLRYGWTNCMEMDNLLQACWWNNRDRASTRALIATCESMPVKTLKDLAITGKDLLSALKKEPGEWIQHVLSHLLEQTALHRLPNTPEALVAEAKREVARYEYQRRDSEGV